MAVERKFVNEAMKKVRIDRYIRGELGNIECGDIDVKRTPLGTRINIHTTKPGLVIGRKGGNIENLTNTLREKFKVDNPQIEVEEVKVPEFDAKIMAKQLAMTIERNVHFRKAANSMLQKIMAAGALGAEIKISGKISGARARYEKFKDGYIKHCGDTANFFVNKATTYASLKPGIIGVKIKITPPAKNISLLRGLVIHENMGTEVKAEEQHAEKEQKAEEKIQEKKTEKKIHSKHIKQKKGEKHGSTEKEGDKDARTE